MQCTDKAIGLSGKCAQSISTDLT